LLGRKKKSHRGVKGKNFKHFAEGPYLSKLWGKEGRAGRKGRRGGGKVVEQKKGFKEKVKVTKEGEAANNNDDRSPCGSLTVLDIGKGVMLHAKKALKWDGPTRLKRKSATDKKGGKE